MLEGEAWNAMKADVMNALGISLKPEIILKRWSQSLDETFKFVAKDLPNNPNVRLETRSSKDDKRTELVIRPSDALPDSESLRTLKANVDSRLPEIPLTEVLLEINARTNFAAEILQDSLNTPHAVKLELSVLAVLIAEACNIGLTAVADERNAALKLARLTWVKKNYVHADTISRANVKLVEYHSSLAITQRWGGGEVASADGIRFVVPVKTIHAGLNPKYFGAKHGITYYTLVSDQFTQLHGQVIPGTIRDSLYILSALLEQPKPEAAVLKVKPLLPPMSHPSKVSDPAQLRSISPINAAYTPLKPPSSPSQPAPNARKPPAMQDSIAQPNELPCTMHNAHSHDHHE
jgi:Tn3 transposase DDE domain